MDVRQYNFLAAQASAAVAPRERFWGMPKRGIALVLANAMFWQPLWAQAEGIVVSGGNTTVGQAGNGVPVINIATPNANGLSHNQFKDYNVESNGLILNNATGRTQGTQLGGIIVGNPNLTNGAATTILNEVNGGSPSQLKGYTEVAGQSARVIVANPYGITCNGCGFINTPRVTLSTGKPVLSNGQLDHFQVDGGSVNIEGAGLNATNVDQFDIVTRSAKLNAELYANRLNVITGRNDVNAETLAATARSGGDSDKPQLAIDSSALGGMYAGAIKLVGTEAGVGVKLAGDMAASAGDIVIDANGQLTMAQTAASGAVIAKAQRLEAQGPVYAGTGINIQTAESLVNQQSMAARDTIVLNSQGQLINQGIIEAGVNPDNSRNGAGEIAVSAQNLTNKGTIKASRALTAHADQTLDNQGGALSSQAQTVVSAQTLDNQQGRVLSNGTLSLSAQNVVNSQKGLITSAGDLTAVVGQLDNQAGELSSQAKATITANAIQNNGGLLLGEQELDTTVTGALDNHQGTVASNKVLTLKAGSLDNSLGQVSSQGNLNLTTQALNNQQGRVIGKGALTLTTDQLDNSQKGLVTSTGDLTAKVGQLNNQTGELSSQGRAIVTANSLQNNSGLLLGEQGLDTAVTGALSNRQGTVASNKAMTLSAASLDNSQQGKVISQAQQTVAVTGSLNNAEGQISSQGPLTLTAQSLDNQQGRVVSNGALSLTADKVVNSQKGLITSAADLTAAVGQLDNQAGELSSQAKAAITANAIQNNGGLLLGEQGLDTTVTGALNNRQGTVASNKALTLKAGSLDNSQQGTVVSQGEMTAIVTDVLDNSAGGAIISKGNQTLMTGTLDNRQGQVNSQGLLNLTAQTLNNRNGSITSDRDLALNAGTVDNSQGQIASKSNLQATVGSLSQQGGSLISQGALTLKANTLENRQAGLVAATHGVTVLAGAVDNRGGEISSGQAVTLTGNSLDNSEAGKVIAGTALTLTMDRVNNRLQATLSGHDSLALTGATLDNSQGGLISSQTLLDLDLSGALDNHDKGMLVSEGVLTARAGSLDNTAGALSSAGALTLTTTGDVVSRGGQIVTDSSLVLSSANLDNQGGTLSAGSKGNGLTLTTGTLDNSQGDITSGQVLVLRAGQVTNTAKGRIASSGNLTADITGLDQHDQGRLFSSKNVTLDLNGGALDNSAQGLLTAPGALVLKNIGTVNNSQGGEISSDHGYVLNATTLDNSGGKLLSGEALELHIAKALANVKGALSAAGLSVQAGSLDNAGGTLVSQRGLELDVKDGLDNSAEGLIAAADDLNIQAGSIDNTASGLINSKGALEILANRLDSSNGGEVSSSGDLQLTLSELIQQQGRLIGESGIYLDLQGGDINNLSGLIAAHGPLSIQNLRDLNNRDGGEVSSQQSFSLTGRTLDNAAGSLISNGQLNLQADQLNNTGGVISGVKGLVVNGGSLDNSQKGTLSSKEGDLTVTLSGVLNNAYDGALVTAGVLEVQSARLDNTQGILSSGSGMSVTTGALDNASGLISSGGTLGLNAQAINNQAGQISADKTLTLVGASLDNAGGSLGTNADLGVTLLGALTNAGGKIASSAPLVLKAATINNQNGQIISQELMTLETGTLDNSQKGTVAANGDLILNATGAVQNNAEGLIYSQGGKLNLTADSVNNAAGILQSQDDLSFVINQGLNNQGGKVLAQAGNLLINSGSVDNTHGTLASLEGMINAKVRSLLRNGGVIQGQSLDLTANGGFSNYNGKVSALGGDATVSTADFDNRNGILYAARNVSVTGNNFDNSGDADGQVAGQKIDFSLAGALNNHLGIIESATTLAITAASLTNQQGQLRALGQSGATALNISGLFDNQNGTLETANTDLLFNVGSFQNTGGKVLHVGTGTFGLSLANVTNAGGSLITRGALTLNADSWINNTSIQAGRLTVNVGNFTQTATGALLASNELIGTGGNWTNDGLIGSDGTLNLNLSGTYTGNGQVTSIGKLGLKANQIVLNGPNSRVTGGGNSTIGAAGALINYGRLTSNADMTINSAQLNNYGTLGSSKNLTVNSTEISNESGLIFSGGNVNLNTNNFKNYKGNLYGLADVTIQGLNGVGNANSITNISGSLESTGYFSIYANSLENKTESFAIGRKLISGVIAVQCHNCEGQHYDVSYWVKETYQSVDDDSSPAASISAGQDFIFRGGDFLNSKSVLAASGNIDIEATDFRNIGSTSGTIERTRAYRTGRVTDGTVERFIANDVVPYNQSNSPDFPNTYYVDSAGIFHLSTPVKYRHRDGGDGDFYQEIRLRDNETGTLQKDIPTGYDFNNIPKSKYDPNNLADLPAGLENYQLVSDMEVAKDGGAVHSAIVQAGGSVSIRATQQLENSVIHEDYAYTNGSNKVQDARTSQTGSPTVVRLNSQLPPDLAKQQVNPTTLPGFVLPTGQNGLFRLAGQASTSDARSINAGSTEISHTSITTTGSIAPGLVRGSSIDITEGHSLLGIEASQPGSGPITQAHASDIEGHPKSVAVTSDVAKDLPSGVKALPSSATPTISHNYLIETNPALTDLKQFMSSDYLLGQIGYDPDQSQKRLGDGLYEQRLIQQAVIARTGQRFIDGLTSDEAMFRYLMDNAIASKNELNLSVGVSLTAEQVAALTHDIVWMEDQVVNGEHVLVPVLYLAQANNRLAPNGALIQGSDVTLIAGQDLQNSGTLRATNNLSAIAGNNIVNSGLIEAGDRLSLLATNDIANKQGGIISARDVNLTTITGDILNERTVTTYQSTSGNQTRRIDFADSAARIEATQDLTLSAGRDISNVGSVLQSGRDMSLTAGRDVSITSAEKINSDTRGQSYGRSSIEQLGSSVTAGQDLTIKASRDLSVIASTINAQRDASLSAVENLTLASAANEQHAYSRSKKVTTQDDHVQQQSSSITAGGSVALSANQDINVIASSVNAGKEAYLYAGKDLNLLAANDSDYSFYSKTKKKSFGRKSTRMTESDSETAVTSSITAGTKLNLSSGQDINTEGAQLDSKGALTASAGRDINLDVAENHYSEASAKTKKGILSGKVKSDSASQTLLTSTTLNADNISLKAENDIALKAAALHADGTVALHAGQDIDIGTAQGSQSSSHASSSSKFKAPLTFAQKAQANEQTSSQALGSSISAGNLDMSSGRDTTIRGSTLVADKDINIDAGRDLAVISAENTDASSSSGKSRNSGIIGSFGKSAFGTAASKQTSKKNSTQQVGSQIASLGGNVSLSAGENYNQIASQVVTPAGNIAIEAKQVDIQSGFDTLSSTHTASTSRTAIGAAVDIALVNAVRDIQQMKEAAGNTNDPRMLALAAVNANVSAGEAVTSAQQLMNGNISGVKASVSFSTSTSKSESSQSGQNVVSSSLAAGGDVSITARGAGKDSHINVIGSDINAGRDVALKADGDINLVAAQNTSQQSSKNSSSGFSAGIGIAGGSQTGITYDLTANKGWGSSNGHNVTQANTHIQAGNSVHLESGHDTNLTGAVVRADQVKADVGGDLNITSLQDSNDYKSKQNGVGIGVSLCVPPLCAGASSVSGSISQQNLKSNYASVSEQSGIKAGNNGFQVNVKGNTDLTGAVIASTDKAVQDGKNSLSTGSLTTSDIKNKAEYKGTSVTLSGGYQTGEDGSRVGTGSDGKAQAGAPGQPLPNKGGFSAKAPIAMYAGGKDSSVTYSGISGAAITITDSAKQQELTGQTVDQVVTSINHDVSSERDGSNKLKPIFDAKEIQTGFEITGKFVQNVGNYLDQKAHEADEARKSYKILLDQANDPGRSDEERLQLRDRAIAFREQAKAIENDWGAGSTYRQIATALVAGVSGNITGGSAQFAQSMVVNYVQQQGSAYIGKLVANGELTEGSPLHSALHAIVGCAGAAASNQACSSGALGGAASSVLTNLFSEANPNETQEERQAKRNLIASLVTGIALMSDPSGAATASNAAIANVDNNWLATQQIVQFKKELGDAKNPLEQLLVAGKWATISSKQDVLTTGGIGLGLAQGGLNDIEGMAAFLKDPIGGLEGMYSVVSNKDVRNKMGEEAFNSLVGSIERMKYALKTGGDDQAVQLGKDLGLLIYTFGSTISGLGGAAKAGVALGKIGIEVSSKTLGQLAAKTGVEVAEDIAQLDKSLKNNIVPPSKPITDNPSKPVVESDKPSGTQPIPDTVEPPKVNEPKPHKSGIAAVQDLEGISPTESGYIGKNELNKSSYAMIDLSQTEKQLLSDIAIKGDKKGLLTENLVDSVAERQGLTPLSGGKYRSNNGFDSVYQSADGTVIIIESKQMNNGAIQLSSKGAGGTLQMSESWVQVVLERIDKKSPAWAAVDKALKNNTLIRGVAAVDKNSQQLFIAKLK